MFDFPHPLGPTIAHKLLGSTTVVASTKDLKPAILMHFKRMNISSHGVLQYAKRAYL